MRHLHLLIAASLIAGRVAAEPTPGPAAAGPPGSGHPRFRAPPDGTAPPLRHRFPQPPSAADSGPDGAARPPRSEMWRRWRESGHSPAELKDSIEKWKATRGERQGERRRWLQTHWGPHAHAPDAVTELRLHAARMAKLARLEQLAETERSGDARQRLLDKIEKLRERENQRHERAMQRLTQASPVPSAAPTPSAAAAPASSGGGQ